MAKSYEELKNEISDITNEVEDGANTANRIGGAMADIADFAKESLEAQEERINEETDSKIAANIVQETGDGEGVVMSQKAVSGKLAELESQKAPSASVYGEDVILGYGLAYDAKNNLILSKDSGVIVSPFIPITNGDAIEWVHRFYEENIFRAVIYDANKQVLDSFGAGNLGYRTFTISKDAAYIRVTMKTDSDSEALIKVNDIKVWNDSFYKASIKDYIEGIGAISVGDITEINKRLDSVERVDDGQNQKIAELDIDSNGYFSKVKLLEDGTLELADSSFCSPFIAVQNGDVVRWVQGNNVLVLYDTNKNKLNKWSFPGGAQYRDITISDDDAAYIRASFLYDNIEDAAINLNGVNVFRVIKDKQSLRDVIDRVGDYRNTKQALTSGNYENIIYGDFRAGQIIRVKWSGDGSIQGVLRDYSNENLAVMYYKDVEHEIVLPRDTTWLRLYSTNVLAEGDITLFISTNIHKQAEDNSRKIEDLSTSQIELNEIANDAELIRRRRFGELNGEIIEENYDYTSTTGLVGYISPYIAVSGEIDVWINYSKVVGYDANRNFAGFWRTTDAVSTISIPDEVKYIRVAVYNETSAESYIKDHITGEVLWKPFVITKPHKSILELFPQEEYEPAIANIMHDYKIDSPDRKDIHTFGMLLFGDLHSCNDIMREIMEFYNLYQSYLGAAVLVGDMVNHWDDGFDWWGVAGANRVLPIIGNHEVLLDYHNYAQTGLGAESAPTVNGVEVNVYKMPAISAKQCYDRFIKPYLGQTAFTSYVENKCYWYKDFSDCKLRLIGLDDFHWKDSVTLVDGTTSDIYPDGTNVDTGEQQLWFRDVLEDARLNGYKVLVAHHAPSQFDAIECPFTIQGFNNVGTRSKATDDELAEVQAFMYNGGTFVAWITGHLHQDVIGTCKGYYNDAVKNYTNQLQIAIDNSRFAKGITGDRYYQGGNVKIADTRSQYCLDILAITEDTITIKRVGSEYDKLGRKIESFAYNFVTHNIVHK